MQLENEARERAQEEEHKDEMKMWNVIGYARRARAGTPAAYLQGRGITLMPPAAMMLAANDSARLGEMRFPAMVLPFRRVGDDGVGRLVGAQCTWLTADGSAKVAGETPRKTFGAVSGGYMSLGQMDAYDTPLLIGEGPETVLAAMQITGLPAGIATGGSINLKAVRVPREWKQCIITADNDKAGQRDGRACAQRLANEGRRVTIATPPVDDWNTALQEARGDEAELARLRQALLNSTAVEAVGEIRALPMEDFMNLQFPVREYLLRPWLVTSGLTMIHAQRGVCKTWFALSVAYAVASGQDLMGWKCERQGRVLYVDGELPGRVLQERLQVLGPLTTEMLILSAEQFALQQHTMPDLGTPEGRAALDVIIEAHKPELIVLDSGSTLVRSGFENEAESWAPIQPWMLAHRWQGRSIILIQHEGRSGKPRGTTKREDVLDTIIGLKIREPDRDEVPSETESSYELVFTKYRHFFGPDAAPLVLHLGMTSG
jgi:putative DNA primase/helicase